MVVDTTADATINTSRKGIRLLLGTVLLLIIVAVGLIMYRSVGFVAANRSYRCAESTIDTIATVNSFVDVDSGAFVENPGELLDELNELRSDIADRDPCLSGYTQHAVGTLSDLQDTLDNKAVAYIDSVTDMAQDPDNMNDSVMKAIVAYKAYLDARSAYEDELRDVGFRFYLSQQ